MEPTTTQAEVTLPVEGKLAITLNHPTPTWVRMIVRALVWISGGWMAMDLAGKLQLFGVPTDVVERVGHIMPIIAAGASIASRYLGIKPPDKSSWEEEATVTSSGATKSDELKSD